MQCSSLRQMFGTPEAFLRPPWLRSHPSIEWIHWNGISVAWMLRRVILLETKHTYSHHISRILVGEIPINPICLVVRPLWSTARWNVPHGPRSQAGPNGRPRFFNEGRTKSAIISRGKQNHHEKSWNHQCGILFCFLVIIHWLYLLDLLWPFVYRPFLKGWRFLRQIRILTYIYI